MASVNQAINSLKKQFPNVHGIKPAVEWGGAEYAKGIHLGDVAEGGEIDGMSAAYYNAGFEDPQEKIWVMGVHKKLAGALEKLGYYGEFYDAGTLIAWPV